SMNYLFGQDVFPFDVLINTCKFSYQSLGAQTLGELKLQDVPIIQGYTIYMDEKTWAADPQGVTPLDVNLSISQPELDGVIQGGVVACQTFDERGHYVYLPVKERIAAIVQRAIKWSTLRHIPVSERKWPLYYITIRLRTPTLALLQVLIHLSRCYVITRYEGEGYTIDTVPETSADLMDVQRSYDE
ncbi:MAG: cobaltochelatase subunit CobN, partial [Veillonella sp.]